MEQHKQMGSEMGLLYIQLPVMIQFHSFPLSRHIQGTFISYQLCTKHSGNPSEKHSPHPVGSNVETKEKLNLPFRVTAVKMVNLGFYRETRGP